jgi:hypothetical protein
MMEPTQGLWQAVGRGVFAGESFICHADFGTPETNERNYDEALANASLIAAAPEMLDLLQAIISNGLLNDSELFFDVGKAIEKAKGNT